MSVAAGRLAVRGHRLPHHSRRARAQPQEHHARASARPADRLHGPVRLGEVLARLRHDLRRGPAALRRVAVRLRAAVPRADGEARRRLHRGSLAGDLDRPEVHLAQPALHRRHDHRGLRLPAGALRARRAPALLQLRPPDRPPDPRADRRPGDGAARGHEVPGAGADRPRAQGRVREAPRRAGPQGVSARSDRRRGPRPLRADPAGQDLQAHDRGRGRPARRQARHPPARRRLDRAGARAGRGHRLDRRRHARGPRGDPDLLPEARVHLLRAVLRRAGARGTSRSTRRTGRARRATASAPGSRSIPSWSCPIPTSPSTTARSRRGRRRRSSTGTACWRPSPTTHGFDLDTPWKKLPKADARDPAVRLRRADPRPLQEPVRAPARVLDDVRGRDPQHRATARRDRLRRRARPARAVHARDPVPGVQGRAAATRDARGHDRRTHTSPG